MTILRSTCRVAAKALGAVALFSVAHAAIAATPPALPFTDQDKADIAAVIKASKPGVPMQLDMSNPLHYRFFVRQMASVGVTPDRYKQLFRVTEAARAAKPPRVETRAAHQLSAASPAVNASQVQGYAVVPIQTLTTLGTADGVNYGVTALSSVTAAYFSSLTVGLYDTLGNQLGTPSTVTSATNPATDLNAGVMAKAPTAYMPVVGLATYFYQDQYGHAVHGTVQGTVSSAPSSISNQSPMPNTSAQPPQTITKLCLGRTGADCTYSPVGGSGSNVLMPLKGSITFSQPISCDTTTQSALITMAKPDVGQGGGCTIQSTGTFFGDPNTKVGSCPTTPGNTISWDITNMQFQQASGCLSPNTTAIYTFTVGLAVGSQPTFVTITSDPTVDPTNPYYKQIPELQVFFSCVAEGTLVTLKGGKRVKIEDLKAGQEVVVDAQGHTQVVESKLRGKEVVPIVVLKTGKNVLMVTDGHPVITDKGPVLAGNLKVGDVVMTNRGPQKLTKVGRQKFGGYVWNLNVGAPPNTLNDPTVTGGQFLASNIFVGDNVMQFVENRKDGINHAKRALRGAPPEWKGDFQSAVQDAAARKVKQ